MRGNDDIGNKRGGIVLFVNAAHKVLEVHYNAFYIVAIIDILGKLALVANAYIRPAISKYRPASYATCLA